MSSPVSVCPLSAVRALTSEACGLLGITVSEQARAGWRGSCGVCRPGVNVGGFLEQFFFLFLKKENARGSPLSLTLGVVRDVRGTLERTPVWQREKAFLKEGGHPGSSFSRLCRAQS